MGIHAQVREGWGDEEAEGWREDEAKRGKENEMRGERERKEREGRERGGERGGEGGGVREREREINISRERLVPNRESIKFVYNRKRNTYSPRTHMTSFPT